MLGTSSHSTASPPSLHSCLLVNNLTFSANLFTRLAPPYLAFQLGSSTWLYSTSIASCLASPLDTYLPNHLARQLNNSTHLQLVTSLPSFPLSTFRSLTCSGRLGPSIAQPTRVFDYSTRLGHSIARPTQAIQ